MANVINATSTGNGGLVSTGDDSGILNIQTNETTAITVDASQNVSFTKGFTVGSTAFPAFSAYAANDQSITNNTFTKVQINTELFDTNSNFDASTNYRFTPTVAGYYQVNCAVKPTTDETLFSVLYKNGSILNYGSGGFAGLDVGSVRNGSVLSQLVYLNGSTDYIEMYAISGNNITLKGSATQTYFSASMARSA